MSTKIVFIGNILGGDDGIGPHLYNELKDHDQLKGFKLIEGSVIGLDLLSYIEKNDHLIIIDAINSSDAIGEVFNINKKDLRRQTSLVSQHEIGVGETCRIIRFFDPTVRIDIIGICVKRINAFNNELSEEILRKIPDIKQKVVKSIIELTKT
jgi:hydrogenase maturation protease